MLVIEGRAVPPAGDRTVSSANVLTIAALDPVAKIPEYKVCAVALERP
jgi:hypothetical protein